MKIERIYICSDFLMTKEKEQYSNLRWLCDLLRRPIFDATSINATAFTSSLVKDGAFRRSKFFELSGIELDIHKTQFYFDDREICDSSLRYLGEFIPQDTLIIGYELSEQTRAILVRMGIVYIDIWLHPIRFLDDILFGFSSNESGVFHEMASFDINPRIYSLYADRLKVQFYKGYKRNELPIKPNSALFVGQTLEDKAVCKNGEMLNLLHFKHRFEEIGKKHSCVYYSRHPYVKSGDEEILGYLRKCKFAQIVDWPVYHMLAHPNLRSVYSISSSVIFEARAFGKPAEFLYKPVIELSAEHGIRNYVSIYQEFVSPHFWAKSLSPIMKVNDFAPKIGFLEGKDKLRDMLAFYWSYKHIDKAEYMRSQLNAVDARVQRAVKVTARTEKSEGKRIELEAEANPVKPPVRANPRDWLTRFEMELKNSQVVSFDIFDTLLVRPFAKPDDLFVYLENDVKSIVGDKINDFRSVRLSLRSAVPKEYWHGEEVTLESRYQTLATSHGLSEAEIECLLKLETEAEIRLVRPRQWTLHLLRRAKEQGKRVILTSDTYFSRNVVERMLGKCGIEGFERLFLSSETGALKATGRMYGHVVEALGIAPDSVLHVGDNLTVDVKNAKAHGWSALHLPRTVEAFEKASKLPKLFGGREHKSRSIIVGLISNQIADCPFVSRPTYANGTHKNFGYAVFGPILLHFALWIIQNARRLGVDHLYFLSRDGHIPLQACKILEDYIPSLPKMSYLLASRRAYNVALLKSLNDVISLSRVNFSPTRLEEILFSRFGVRIDDLPAGLLTKRGFAKDTIVSSAQDQLVASGLITDLAPFILQIAKQERIALEKYLNECGLGSSEGSVAVVDIGHNGSLQRALKKLTGRERIKGLYFATFKTIRENLGHGEFLSFLGELDPKDKEHPYIKHLLMYEVLFQNNQASLVRFSANDDGVFPVFLNEPTDNRRAKMADEIHEGALKFIKDVGEVAGSSIEQLFGDVSGVEAIQHYATFLSKPELIDVEPFVGVAFENVFSGRGFRPLVSEFEGEPGIWKEGSELFTKSSAVGSAESETTQPEKWAYRLLTAFYVALNQRGLLEDKKFDKFRRNPSRFFADSRLWVVRQLGKWVLEKG